MTSPFRDLVVVRADWQPNDDKHVRLSVQPEIARVVDDSDRSIVDGFDATNPAAWRNLGFDALDVAGTLARLALDIHADLFLYGFKEHGCDIFARRWGDDRDEIPDAMWGTGCGVELSHTLKDNILDAGYLPHLAVTVPRNREHAWTARLRERLAEFAAGVAATLNTDWLQPANHQEEA